MQHFGGMENTLLWKVFWKCFFMDFNKVKILFWFKNILINLCMLFSFKSFKPNKTKNLKLNLLTLRMHYIFERSKKFL